MSAMSAKENPDATPLARSISCLMSEEKLDWMFMLFNTAYYVAKEERPFSDFGPLVLLQRKNGLQIGEQYANGKA